MKMGHAMVQLVEALRYKPEGRGIDYKMVSLEIFIDIILPAALWSWG
jgi:nitrate reductase alpha subunit